MGARTMPDGTVLVLEQISTRSPHQLEIRQPGGSLLKALFDRGTNVTTQQIVAAHSGSGPMIWLTRWHPLYSGSLDFDWWQTAVLVDAQGDEIPDSYAACYYRAPGTEAWIVGTRPWPAAQRVTADLLVATSQFPFIRQPEGHYPLRIYDHLGECVAEFTIPWPETRDAPQWRPEALPARLTAGDLQVVVRSVTCDQLPRDPRLPRSLHRLRPQWQVVPELEIFWKGRPTSYWRTEQSRLSDALGNMATAASCGLSRQETAWKLEITLVRDAREAFTPEEQWTSPLVPLPASDSRNPIELRQVVQNRTITLTALGRGEVLYTDFADGPLSGRSTTDDELQIGRRKFRTGLISVQEEGGPILHSLQVTGDSTHLLVELAGLPPDHHEIFLMRDDQGRELPHKLETVEIGDRLFAFLFLDPPDDATALELTTIVHTHQTVSVHIAPPPPDNTVNAPESSAGGPVRNITPAAERRSPVTAE